MRLLPPSRIARVEFFEVHLEPWMQHAETLGLSEAELSALAGLVGEARAAFTAQQEAADAARAATLRFHTALRAMQAAGAGAIRTIRNTAAGGAGGGAGGGDPNVYTLAQIPPPATPGRSPRPGTPFGFRATLLTSGAVELTFQCHHPGRGAGTMYEVRRRTETAAAMNGVPANGYGITANGDGLAASASGRVGHAGGGGGHAGDRGAGFEYLGLTGRRRFTDATLPGGTATATYEVTAVRATGRGQSARFTLHLGVETGRPALSAACVA